MNNISKKGVKNIRREGRIGLTALYDCILGDTKFPHILLFLILGGKGVQVPLIIIRE